MEFKNTNQWKDTIKKQATEKNISAQELQQLYVLEEFANNISLSKYRNIIVFKGGFVVSHILGINERLTRDIDMTFCSKSFSIDEIKIMINEIINIESNNLFKFEIVTINREQFKQGHYGFVCRIDAVCGKLRVPFKLDISNNTMIYPYAIESSFMTMSGKKISIMTYHIENIIAEKFETTLDRGTFNSRIRDLQDVCCLFINNNSIIDCSLLVQTIIEVSKNRNTLDNLYHYNEIKKELLHSAVFNQCFESYRSRKSGYAPYSLKEVFMVFDEIMNYIKSELDNL